MGNPNMMMMGGMNPAMKQGMGNMNMMGGSGMGGHPNMVGASNNSMPGNPNQGWQGQPGPTMPNTNPSLSQGQTLSTSSMSSMSRQSPGVLSGPNSAGESQPMPGMNSRIQNMGNMPPNIPMETQRGSPGLTGPAGEQGAAMMGRHNVRNSGPANFPGNMPNQMNPQQMSMANVRMPMGGMPGLGPGQRPMGPG